MKSKCCERLVLPVVNGVNLGRKRTARSDPGGFRRKLLLLVGSVQTVGGRGTEMDTSYYQPISFQFVSGITLQVFFPQKCQT